MIHQFRNDRNPFFQIDNIAKGIFFSVGFFKKIVIADNLSIWVDKAFFHINQLTMIDAWCSSLSFTFQIYFDFSGYTDMAIGLALLFGINLPKNFNSPYKAVNIQDFWRRWHITLSKWFRDYIYVSLGGNRVPWAKNYINLIIVFIVGGIWHGAGWTFVVWGLLNGVAIVVHRIWNRFDIEMPRMMARLMTFLFVNITWIIFRSPHLQSAKTFIGKLFSFSDLGITQSLSQFLSNLIGWRFFTYVVVPETPINIINDPVPLIFFYC